VTITHTIHSHTGYNILSISHHRSEQKGSFSWLAYNLSSAEPCIAADRSSVEELIQTRVPRHLNDVAVVASLPEMIGVVFRGERGLIGVVRVVDELEVRCDRQSTVQKYGAATLRHV
jgi:hypothetical protein